MMRASYVALGTMLLGGCFGSPTPIDFGNGGPDGGGIDFGFGCESDLECGSFESTGPQPSFGTTITAATPPAPLSGGTLRILPDGKTAVAADPDRDQVYVVDLAANQLTSTIALAPGDEPGRSIVDAAGRVHVVTRRGGALVTLDVVAGQVTDRRAVCPAPRGLAYDPATDLLHVACAGGELVSLPAAGGVATRTLQLEQDLRDVIVVGTGLWVSTFRTAHIIPVSAAGAIGTTIFLPSGTTFSPAVAWRMALLPSGQVGIAHQEGQVGPVMTTTGGYGGGESCDSIVVAAVSFVDPSTMQVTASGTFAGVSLPVDLDVAPNAGSLALLSAGSSHTPQVSDVSIETLLDFTSQSTFSGPPAQNPPDPNNCYEDGEEAPMTGEVIALAYDGKEQLWVQTREPASLQMLNSSAFIPLSTNTRADTGWAIFHSDSGAGLACASCHPEGGEDGRTWQFDGLGARRTQSLRGKISGTAPFHWDGTLPDFPSLVSEVYNSRMSGPLLMADQEQALLNWIDGIPTLPHSPPADASAVTRGQALFTSAGCIACHSGPEFTNNQTVDVGTGGNFQVARLLGVAWRAPFLHDGRAATLTDRFGSGGGGDQHGMTSTLSAADISDLVAYLGTI